MYLSELKKGEMAKVISILNSNNNAERLKKLGLTEGVNVKVVRFAPLGDPMEIKLRSFSLAIRKSDAKNITVEKLL